MKSEIIKRFLYGVAYGGINTFIALTILMFNDINPPVSIIWLYMLAGLMLGVYFGLSSFIFEIETWSPLKKTTIHFSASIICYFIIALLVGWVPFQPKAMMITTLIFMLVYTIFWWGYRLYYKREEAAMNDKLQKR